MNLINSLYKGQKMNRKNIIEILSKEARKAKDPTICLEFSIWRVRTEYEPNSFPSYLENEKSFADRFFKNNSIVSKHEVMFGGTHRSYLDVKKISLVRKYVEILLKK